MTKPKILLIGPLPPPIGGATVSFNLLVKECLNRAEGTIVIDTAIADGSWLRKIFSVVGKFALYSRRNQVATFHLSEAAAFWLWPAIVTLARIRFVAPVLRLFGGGFEEYFESRHPLFQRIFEISLSKTPIVFAETKKLVTFFEKYAETVHWLPNYREDSHYEYRKQFAEKADETIRCVYVGHVRGDKGVMYAAEAVNSLSFATLDIYGSIVDLDITAQAGGNIRYNGEISQPDLVRIISNYDLMIFPTFYEGEGYPGVLIEAASVGLPIITTSWRSIPEMFTKDEVFFVNPRSVAEISKVLHFIKGNRSELILRSERLKKAFHKYSIAKNVDLFLNYCSKIK